MRFEGQDISRPAPHCFRAQGIALVPGRRRLFTEMTLRENLELGSYLRAARIVALGRPDELMARPELRRAYLGLDAEHAPH